MGVSPSWIREITGERDRLAGDHAKLRDELNHVLARVNEVQDRIKVLDAVIAMYGGNTAAPIIGEAKAAASGPLASMGLRDAIRHVLLEGGTAMKPAAVVRGLKAGGFQYGDGKTDLTTRVSNEMWRMAKRRLLQRSKHGYRFQMANPPGVGAPEGLFS
jgi:hypothetical protein